LTNYISEAIREGMREWDYGNDKSEGLYTPNCARTIWSRGKMVCGCQCQLVYFFFTTPSLNASSHFQHKLPGPHTLQHSRNEDDDHMDTTGMAGDLRPACLESSEVSFFFLSIFFYYTNDYLKVDYASPPIHFDTSNHQQTATTNMAPRWPSGDERARDASRVPRVRFFSFYIYKSLLTCIYNKIGCDCVQTATLTCQITNETAAEVAGARTRR
jgi:hypothetical protein